MGVAVKAAGKLADAEGADIEKSLATSGKASAGEREAAFLALLALRTEMGAIVYPILTTFLTKACHAMADKVKPVTKAAAAFAKDLVENSPPQALPIIMQHMVDEDGMKWQGSLLKMELVTAFAGRAPEQTARSLTLLMPLVSKLMWHDKAALKDAAVKCMNEVSATMDNRDIEERVPDLISVIIQPDVTDELIQRLAGIIFVQEIKAEALSVMLPVLTRSLSAQSIIKTKRMAARVVDNMSKLVDEPKECQVFLPKVLPLLEKAMNDVPDPECREVCEKAYNQLKRSGDTSLAAKGTDLASALSRLEGVAVDDVTKAYAASMAVCFADLKNFEVADWTSVLAAQYNRPLTQAFVEQHIMDVGLEREFGTHTRMSALSGGQKVKVVLAASLWKAPHIIILDEPTNYLDRESLGALADAIKEYDGGIVIVSHNNEFCKACCPETWIVASHTLDVQGDPKWLAQAEKEKVKDKSLDNAELKDAYGNDVTIQTKKVPTKQEMKKLKKSIAKRRKEGEEVWTDEEMEKMGYVMDVA